MNDIPFNYLEFTRVHLQIVRSCFHVWFSADAKIRICREVDGPTRPPSRVAARPRFEPFQRTLHPTHSLCSYLFRELLVSPKPPDTNTRPSRRIYAMCWGRSWYYHFIVGLEYYMIVWSNHAVAQQSNPWLATDCLYISVSLATRPHVH